MGDVLGVIGVYIGGCVGSGWSIYGGCVGSGWSIYGGCVGSGWSIYRGLCWECLE